MMFHFHSASSFSRTGFQLIYDTQRVEYNTPTDANTYFAGFFLKIPIFLRFGGF